MGGPPASPPRAVRRGALSLSTMDLDPSRVRLRDAVPGDHETLAAMLAAYQAIIGALSDVPDAGRVLEDRWFTHEDLFPYLIEVDGAPAGMALVLGPRHAAAIGEDCDRVIYDYYVEDRWRGTGAARLAAHQLFERKAGRYAIAVIEANERAVGFWSAVLRERGIEAARTPGAEGLPTFRFTVS